MGLTIKLTNISIEIPTFSKVNFFLNPTHTRKTSKADDLLERIVRIEYMHLKFFEKYLREFQSIR